MFEAVLEWDAVVLPTLLAIVGVFVSIETPHLQSSRAKWAVRGGLLAFGLFVSVITAVQQKYARDETSVIKGLLGTIADAVKVDRSGSAQTLADEILKKLPSADWHLTDQEKQKLGEILDLAPEQSRFSIAVLALIGSIQSQMYKDDLAAVIKAHHWPVTGGVDTGLRADLEPIRKLLELDELDVIPYQALDSLGGERPMWKPEHRRAADRSSLRYPSDLTNAEWELVAPKIPPARHGGRRRSVNVREVLNGIFYILWTGCQWKALPKDLPPKSTVHDYLELWNWDGTLERIHHELYVAVREQEGREPSPTAAIIDSQTAKGAQKGGLGSILRATTRARRSRVVSGTSWSTRWASC